jgi:hypothetical protein
LPSFSFQPVRLAVEGGDGLLVFADGLLVGVLARLSDQHGEDVGYWFLEAAIGPLADVVLRPTFPDLKAVQGWLSERVQRVSA